MEKLRVKIAMKKYNQPLQITPKNNHAVEAYNFNGESRIAFEIYTDCRMSIPISEAKKLIESLEYGLKKASEQEGRLDS